MSEEHAGWSKKAPLNGGLIALIFIGLQLAIVVINLVVSTGYASKTEFNALKDSVQGYRESNGVELSHIRENVTTELSKTANAVTELNGKMSRNIEQDKELDDHEQRLRRVEEMYRKK